MTGIVGQVEVRSLAEVRPNGWNPNVVPPHIQASIVYGLRKDGWVASQALLVWATDETGASRNLIIDGEHRWRAAREAGMLEGPMVRLERLSEREAKAFTVKLNQKRGSWDPTGLAELLRAVTEGATQVDAGVSLGFTPEEIARLAPTALPEIPPETMPPTRSLVERFVVPPFSVLDARQGYWQARKARWIALGLRSSDGRTDTLEGMQSAWATANGRPAAAAPDWTRVSIFDPVLAELLIRWFSPPGGHVLDPFAGGSVRGVVAAALGRTYYGVELRPEQIAANVAQWREIRRKRDAGKDLAVAAGWADGAPPRWEEGDAATADLGPAADFILACPPYYDLEKYSSDPRDLSAMTTEGFRAAYRAIIARAAERLREDRFAAWVVGNARDSTGRLRDLVGETVEAFRAAGAALYNDAVLLTSTATLGVRVPRQFPNNRKLGRSHQYVLVFAKGDPLRAAAECGDVELPSADSAETDVIPEPAPGA